MQGGSNMNGTSAACLHTNQSLSYLNHLVLTMHRHTNVKSFVLFRVKVCASYLSLGIRRVSKKTVANVFLLWLNINVYFVNGMSLIILPYQVQDFAETGKL